MNKKAINNKKTALVLGGGGGRGAFQIGVWKAFKEENISFDMVIGVSVGAINGTMVCLDEYQLAEDMWQNLSTYDLFEISPDDLKNKGEYIKSKLNSLKISENSFTSFIETFINEVDINGLPLNQAYSFSKKAIYSGGASSKGVLNLLNKYVKEDALRNSPIDYGLVVTKFPSLEGEHLFLKDIPNGKVNDFIHASTSCFPLAQTKIINGETYIDGGYTDNLPISMAIENGASKIYSIGLRGPGNIDYHAIAEASKNKEVIEINPKHNLGNFLYFGPSMSTRNILLGYRAGRRILKKEDGDAYSFKKDWLKSDNIENAENLAEIFNIDPTKLYDEEILKKEISPSLKKSKEFILKRNLKITPLNLLPYKTRPKIICLSIAIDLINNKNQSLFLEKGYSNIFKKELAAAQLLTKWISSSIYKKGK